MNSNDKSQKADSSILPPKVGIEEKKIESSQYGLPKCYTLSELEKIEFDLHPLVDGLIYKGQLSLVEAKPKVGKSTILRFLAKCFADGEAFLGRSVVMGPVLYLACEEPLGNVKRDFTLMNVGNKEGVSVATLGDVRDRFHGVSYLVREKRPSLVIIDTLVHVAGIKDMNDYAQTTVALKRIRDLAEEFDCHIMLVHHSRKGESVGHDSVLGSTGISGAVDLIVKIEMDSNRQRLISSGGRTMGDHFDRTPLNYDESTKHFSLSTNYVSRDEDELKECIKNNPGISRDALQSKLKRQSSKISAGLDRLESEGVIRIEKSGKKNLYFIANLNAVGEE